MRECTECGTEVEMLWNLGRCWDCHDASCRYGLFSDTAPEGFDPMDAGERWEDDY